jgi:ketosteroid isomerase-like protein
MPSAMPADILARRRELMLAGDADGLADLFAPDAMMEFAFHGPPGTSVRVEGREAIREYSRRVMAFRDFADPRGFEEMSAVLGLES